jgi:hypothetical protein
MAGPSTFDELIKRLGAPRRLQLPEIPERYVRLTHVMPERSRQILASGEPFVYRRYGLDGTTDAYSDNESIEWLARTGDPAGRPGAPSRYSRNEFGDHMALMDLPAEAHKRIALSRGAYDDPIPNQAILGFIDRRSMAFEPNPRYDRAAIEEYGQRSIDSILRALETRNARFSHRPFVLPSDIYVPPARAPFRQSDDIW